MWTNTEEKDISFEHCNRPAYWEGEDIYCSRCGERMPDSV